MHLVFPIYSKGDKIRITTSDNYSNEVMTETGSCLTKILCLIFNN